MSLNNSNLKLALVLALSLVGPAACNNQKAEQLEEDAATEAQSDASPTRDNRSSQSGDAAFIKIFPDGDLVVTRGETATVSAPAQETATPAPAESVAQPSSPAEEPAQTPTETASQPDPEPSVVVTEPAPAPAAEPTPAPEPAVAVNEPASAPAPAPIEEQTAKDAEDTSRPVLTLNESNAATIISVLPKENKSIVAIGKHNDFAPGPYMIMAKWTNDSKKVKVNVTSSEAKDKNCAIDESATQGEWKTIGVFYLTKNAKVIITNAKNSSYAVKNELLLKPVIAENVNSPSKFKCLDGQIDGHGLVAFP